jgi:hypothetical protein
LTVARIHLTDAPVVFPRRVFALKPRITRTTQKKTGESPSQIGTNFIETCKMSNHPALLINTRLQPGVGSTPTRVPFQHLVGTGKTVETVLTGLTDHHRAEARC